MHFLSFKWWCNVFVLLEKKKSKLCKKIKIAKPVGQTGKQSDEQIKIK